MILAIGNQKGGTGKTITALTLAQAATMEGARVLAVDLDAQCNLTQAAGEDASGVTSYDVMMGGKIRQAIRETRQGFNLLPGSWNLAELTTKSTGVNALKQAFKDVSGEYDHIIIDTPPTLGTAQINAVMVADFLIIPVYPDAFNLQGVYLMIETVREIRPDLKTGIVFCQYDQRSTLNRKYREVITEQAAALGAEDLGAVRAAVAVREAAALGRSLYEYAPDSKPAADYMEIWHKIKGGKV